MPFGNGNSSGIQLLPLDQERRRTRIRRKEIPTRSELKKIDVRINPRRHFLAEETIPIGCDQYDQQLKQDEEMKKNSPSVCHALEANSAASERSRRAGIHVGIVSTHSTRDAGTDRRPNSINKG